MLEETGQLQRHKRRTSARPIDGEQVRDLPLGDGGFVRLRFPHSAAGLPVTGNSSKMFLRKRLERGHSRVHLLRSRRGKAATGVSNNRSSV